MKRLSLFVCFALFALGPSRSMALTGSSSDVNMLVSVNKSILESWLPKGVSLAQTDSDQYPLFMNVGRQSGVGNVLLPYTELSVKVPHVHFTNDPEQKSFNFYKVLYMNNEQAVFWGIVIYDCPKQYADMTLTDSVITASQNGNEIFHLDYAPGDVPTISSDNPNYQEFSAWASDNEITNAHGAFQCWNISRRGSSETIAPVRATVSLKDGFIPGLPPTTQTFQGIDEQRFGTFQYTSSWDFHSISCPKGN